MKRKIKSYATFDQFCELIKTHDEVDQSFLSHYTGSYSCFRLVILAYRNCLTSITKLLYDTLLDQIDYIFDTFQTVCHNNEVTIGGAYAFQAYYGIMVTQQPVANIADQLSVSSSKVRGCIRKVSAVVESPTFRDILISGINKLSYSSVIMSRPLDTVDRMNVAQSIIDDCRLPVVVRDDDNFYAMIGKLFEYGGKISSVTTRMLYDHMSDMVIWKFRVVNGLNGKSENEYQQGIPEFRHNKKAWVRYIIHHREEIMKDLNLTPETFS